MERNNAQTNVFKHFLQRHMLKICWEHTQAKLTSTYCNYELNNNSCIDHFVLTPRMFDSIRKCVIDKSPLNPIHHRIITFEIEYKLEYHNVENRKWIAGKIAWHKVEEEHIHRYKQRLNDLLDAIGLYRDVWIAAIA